MLGRRSSLLLGLSSHSIIALLWPWTGPHGRSTLRIHGYNSHGRCGPSEFLLLDLISSLFPSTRLPSSSCAGRGIDMRVLQWVSLILFAGLATGASTAEEEELAAALKLLASMPTCGVRLYEIRDRGKKITDRYPYSSPASKQQSRQAHVRRQTYRAAAAMLPLRRRSKPAFCKAAASSNNSRHRTPRIRCVNVPYATGRRQSLTVESLAV